MCKGGEKELFTPFSEEEGQVFKVKRGMGEDGRVGKRREGKGKMKEKWKGRGSGRKGQRKGRKME
jgi:hypothetical protein